MVRGSRNPSVVFKAVLKSARDQIAVASAAAGAFKHSGIKGDERAAALADFFRAHLPSQYGVAKGEVIDFRDRRTGQLDIIIYDADMAAPISSQAENVLIPAESLLVVLEVKTILSKAETEKCFRAAKKVDELRPFKRQFVPPPEDGQPADDRKLRCLYIVFSYSTDLTPGNWPSNEFARLRRAAKATKTEMSNIDLVSVLDRGLVRPAAGVGKIDDGAENTFLELYLHVVNFLRREQPRRPPMDWQAYTAKSSKGWKKLP